MAFHKTDNKRLAEFVRKAVDVARLSFSQADSAIRQSEDLKGVILRMSSMDSKDRSSIEKVVEARLHLGMS